MREFEIYIDSHGNEDLDKVKIYCEHFDIADERTVMADAVIITFTKDIHSVRLKGVNIYENEFFKTL